MTHDELKELFVAETDWRANKAAEYPEDKRNIKAAKIFERLAQTAMDVPQHLLDAYGAVFSRWESYEVSVLNSDALREVGFHSEPETAAAWIKDFLERVAFDRQRVEEPYRPTLVT